MRHRLIQQICSKLIVKDAEMISNDLIVNFKHIRRINPVFLSMCEQVFAYLLKNLFQY